MNKIIEFEAKFRQTIQNSKKVYSIGVPGKSINEEFSNYYNSDPKRKYKIIVEEIE